MFSRFSGVPLLIALPLLFLTAACDSAVGSSAAFVEASARPSTEGSQSALLRAVRQSTARFNSTTQALRAGYEEDLHCVAHPVLGGMGYHWVNGGLIDPVFDPLQPEALLYATGPGGNLRLVGVEYIVINVGQERPTFAGYPLDIGGVPPLGSTPHWSLHVWLYQDNPNGLFTPFNPAVSCP